MQGLSLSLMLYKHTRASGNFGGVLCVQLWYNVLAVVLVFQAFLTRLPSCHGVSSSKFCVMSSSEVDNISCLVLCVICVVGGGGISCRCDNHAFELALFMLEASIVIPMFSRNNQNLCQGLFNILSSICAKIAQTCIYRIETLFWMAATAFCQLRRRGFYHASLLSVTIQVEKPCNSVYTQAQGQGFQCAKMCHEVDCDSANIRYGGLGGKMCKLATHKQQWYDGRPCPVVSSLDVPAQ